MRQETKIIIKRVRVGRSQLENIAKLIAHRTQRTYKKGEIILHAGQAPSSVFYITKGFVKYYSIDDDGNEALIGINRATDIFPIGWLTGASLAALYYYEAMTSVTICLISRAGFMSYLKDDPAIALALYTDQLDHTIDLSNRVNGLLQAGARHKILYCLRYLAHRYGRNPTLVSHKKVLRDFTITHQMIADMVGLSRETVSIEMKKLSREGYVSQQFHRLIVDTDKIDQLLDR